MPSPLLSEIFNESENEWIPLQRLADLLEIDVQRLYPLAKAKYLHLKNQEVFDQYSEVLKPKEQAMEWLRGWFMEPAAKPLFSLQDACVLANKDAKEVLAIVSSAKIPMIVDPALGVVFSMRSMRRIIDSKMRAKRFDRISQVCKLLGMYVIPYSEALEMEIARIAKMEEPERTVRSVALANAIKDAQIVAGLGKLIGRPST